MYEDHILTGVIVFFWIDALWELYLSIRQVSQQMVD